MRRLELHFVRAEVAVGVDLRVRDIRDFHGRNDDPAGLIIGDDDPP